MSRKISQSQGLLHWFTERYVVDVLQSTDQWFFMKIKRTIDLKTYIFNSGSCFVICGNNVRDSRSRATPQVSHLSRDNFHLSRDISILLRDKSHLVRYKMEFKSG